MPDEEMQRVWANFDKLSVEIAKVNVKMDHLYGENGQMGAVDRLSEKVSKLGDKIVYASGFLAGIVLLVGWYIKITMGSR